MGRLTAAAKRAKSRRSRTRPLVIGPRASGKRTWNYDYNRCELTNNRALSHSPERKIAFDLLIPLSDLAVPT